MVPETTMRPAALVGVAEAEVVVPVSWAEVAGRETEVEGLPVAVRMEVSEDGRVDAVRVLLPTMMGTTGATLLGAEVTGLGTEVVTAVMLEVAGPTETKVVGTELTLMVVLEATGTTAVVVGTMTGAVGEVSGTTGAVETVGGQ